MPAFKPVPFLAPLTYVPKAYELTPPFFILHLLCTSASHLHKKITTPPSFCTFPFSSSSLVTTPPPFRAMAKTRGGRSSSSHPRWRPSSSSQATRQATDKPTELDDLTSPTQATSLASPTVPRYTIRTRPVPLALPYPRPAPRQPPSKWAKTSGHGETSQPQPEVPPQSPPPPSTDYSIPETESHGSTIMRPLFPYALVVGNTDCRNRDFHDENFYDMSAFID